MNDESSSGPRGARIEWLPLAVVSGVALVVYATALQGGLHVDDQYQIVTNPWIRSLRNIPTIFSSGVWDFDGRVSSYYRPMMYVLYMLVYSVAGAAPWAYHTLNILLHAGTAALVYLLARELVDRRAAKAESWWLAPAFLAGVLFAVHPIHTEPVAWAAGVVELSYSLFYLLALYLIVTGRGRSWLMVAALASYAGALLSKEPAITLPALALLYWSLFQGHELGVKGVARRIAPFVVVSAAYLVLRRFALGGLAPLTSTVSLSPWSYILTSCALLGRFLRAQVFPTELNFWHLFHPVQSILGADGLIAFATVGAFAAALAWAISRRAWVPTLALTLAVVPLTPALLLQSLNQGLENAFAERYVYLPSVGAVLLVAWSAAALRQSHPRAGKGLAAGLLVVALIGAVVTLRRNPVWQSSLSLWEDAVAKSPDSGTTNLNYGLALMSAGRAAAGQLYVERAVALQPALVDREMRRAISYAQAGRWKDSVLAFHVVLVMDPRSAAAHYNLALLYEQRGSNQMAVGEYETALRIDPGQADVHNNLGTLYLTLGVRDKGIMHLSEAARLRPDDPDIRSNLARALALSSGVPSPSR